MGKIILTIIGLFIAIIGIIMIFDARLLTQKFFGFGDQNEDNNSYTYANSFDRMFNRRKSRERIHSHNGAGTDGN